MGVAIFVDGEWRSRGGQEPPPPPYLARINVGGGALVDADGNTWQADDPAAWSGGQTFTYSTPNDVAGTNLDPVFITQRYGPTGGTMTRHLDLPAGDYVLRLLFAEQTTSYQKVAHRSFTARIFDVTFDTIDVYRYVGGYAHLALERGITVVGDQGIDVVFDASLREAFVNGIVVRSGTDAAPDPEHLHPYGPGPEPSVTSDPQANDTTRKMLATILGYSGKTGARSFMFGQHIGRTTTAGIETIKAQSGFDVAWISIDVAQRYTQQMVDICAAHHAAGGFIQVGAHSPNPVTGLDAFTDRTEGNPNAVDHATLLTPGSSAHNAFVAHLNDICDFFQALNARGVSVVFRPLHEPTNTDFWFGALGNTSLTPARYRALFAFVRNHVINVRGCHNVLFWWSNHKNFNATAAARGSMAAWTPEPAHVDGLGGSHYGMIDPSTIPPADVTRWNAWFSAWDNGGWLGKPVAITECGGETGGSGAIFDATALLEAMEDVWPGKFTHAITWTGGRHQLETADGRSAFYASTTPAWREHLAGVVTQPSAVGGDINAPGADAPRLTDPDLLAIFSGENRNMARWGNHSTNRAENLEFAGVGDGSYLMRWKNPGNLTYPEARWGGTVMPRLDKLPNTTIPGQNKLVVSYDVTFPLNFPSGKHGKMPGIAGVVPGFNNISSGGTFYGYSFAMRLLFQGDMGLSNYCYCKRRGTTTIEQNGNRGFSTRFIKQDGTVANVFTRGKTHRVTVAVTLNTAPGVADGIMEVWVDGYMGLRQTNFEIVTTAYPTLKANIFFFESFFGGDETDMPNYSSAGVKGPDNPVHTDFDRILVGKTYASVQRYEPPPTNVGQLATWTEDFIESIGINTHWHYNPTPYYIRQTEARAILAASGIRNIRDYPVQHRVPTYRYLYDEGDIRMIAVQACRKADGGWEPADGFAALWATTREIRAYGGLKYVQAVNEPDNGSKFGGGTSQWVTIVRNHLAELKAAHAADPAMASIPIVGPPLVSTSKFDDLGSITSYGVTHGAIHPYPGGAPPENRVSDHMNASRQHNVGSSGKILATETMYHTNTGQTTEHLGSSESSMATYVNRLFLHYFNLGIETTYSYEFLDQYATAAQEHRFGMLRHDLSPKPAWLALTRLIARLADGGRGATRPAARRFNYTINRTTAQVGRHLFHKRSGKFHLMTWGMQSVWNPVNQTPITDSGLDVTVGFPAGARSVVVWRPLTGAVVTPIALNAVSVTYRQFADPLSVEVEY